MSNTVSGVARLSGASAREFGKYRLLAKLGQGGMADVFLAFSRGPGTFAKLVVIKRLKGIDSDESLEGMFLDEAGIAARLNHPNVVQTNEVGKVEDRFYLCMEYLEGQPLHRLVQRMARRRVEAMGELLHVLADALAGLHYAHELADYDGSPLSLVHRDVSPQNVFVTYDGTTKVVDFGIAKAALRSSVTSTGVVKGKVSYMAPEQATSSPVDRRADVFSLGVMLFEALAGDRLWGDMTEVQILKHLAFGQIPKLAERAPDVPRELDAIVSRALAVSPDERYATALAFRDDIEAYAKDAGLVTTNGDVSRLVTELFREERDEVRLIVQEQVARLAVNDARPIEEAAEALPPVAEARLITNDTPSGGSALVATGPTVEPAPARRGSVILALGAAAAVLGVGAFLRVACAKDPPREPAPVAAIAPAPALVQLRVETVPKDATIFIDDIAAASNPFMAQVAADRAPHKLRVEATGFKPDARLVVFDQDRTVVVRLAPESETSASPSPSAASSGPPSPARPSRPDRHSPRPSVKVDTSDPWR